MAIAVVEHKIGGADAAVTSKSVTFTSPGQPDAGNFWAAFGAVRVSVGGTKAINTPAGLTVRQSDEVGGQWGILFCDKTSSGSDGVTTTLSQTSSSAMGLFAINLSGVGALTTSGKANNGGSSTDGITVTADGAVAVDGSLAIAVFFRSGTLQGGTPITRLYSSGWSELTYVADFASPVSEVEVYVATKTVNIVDGTVSCVFDPSGSNSPHAAFIAIYEPASSPPPTASMDSPPGALEIYEGDSVVLAGSATGGTSPYKNWLWTIVESLSGVSNQTVQNPGAVAFPNDGIWTLRLTVDDDLDQGSDPVDRTITVLNIPNLPPLAEAGPTQSVNVGVLVTLDGTGSSDPEDDSLTYAWSINEEPVGSAISLSSTTASQPTFTPTHLGNYVFNLIVNDGTSDSPSDTVTIIVEPSTIIAQQEQWGFAGI